MKFKNSRQVFSWAFYDWANSAYATTVMAGFFPIFFKQYWFNNADVSDSTLQLGLANSAAGLIVVIIAPFLGAIADRSNGKKRFLLFFAVMGMLMTACLYLVEQGNWQVAIMLYIFATLGFMGGNIFYDSLIIDVCDDSERDLVSSFGYALGYLGGGVLFSINVAMTLWPDVFGLTDKTQAVQLAFISVGLWWALFSIPVFLFVKENEKDVTEPITVALILSGFTQLAETFREIRKLRFVLLFLVAYWLYIDGVDTVVRMAVDYGLSIGFNSNDLIIALLITQFVGFPATILFGYAGSKFGTKPSIIAGLFVYLGIVVWAYFMDNVNEFYMMAVVIGLVQGAVQSLSRSFYSRIIPGNRAAQFFGFYNMWGKFAAIIGPLLMGWVGVITGSPRLSILSLAILFIAGAVILYFVDEEEAKRMVENI